MNYNSGWALEVEVQQHAAAGWIAGPAQARRGGEVDAPGGRPGRQPRETHRHPGRILPARELLGDMLLETGQPALALQAYEASQQREPNRLRGYQGAARAADASGNPEKAKLFYAKVIDLTKNADSPRPEVTQAKAYVAK